MKILEGSMDKETWVEIARFADGEPVVHSDTYWKWFRIRKVRNEELK